MLFRSNDTYGHEEGDHVLRFVAKHLDADSRGNAYRYGGEEMVLLLPESPEALRDRGLMYQRLDCFRPALSDLQNYVRRSPAADDLGAIQIKIEELKLACSRLN